MVTIVQNPAPVLRKIAKEVAIPTISSPKVRQIIEDMKTALDSQDDGVAIAAPQIGESLRIFLVSERVLDIQKERDEKKDVVKDDKKYGHIVFINPVITKLSKTKSQMEEGCLSVRYAYGKVRRSNKATISAYNEKGEPFTRGASGLMAQIFQHETDHLNGVLFIDTATDVKEMPPHEDESGIKN